MADSGRLLETVACADARTISEALKALPAASEQQTPIEVVAANRVVSLLEERHLLQAELNQLREEKAHPPGSDALAEASDRSSAQSVLHAPAVSPRASYETQEAVWKELHEMKSMIVRLQEELHMSFASSNDEASRVNHAMHDEMKVLQEQIQSKDTCNENLLRTIHIMSDSYLKHLQSSIASSRKERFNAISAAFQRQPTADDELADIRRSLTQHYERDREKIISNTDASDPAVLARKYLRRVERTASEARKLAIKEDDEFCRALSTMRNRKIKASWTNTVVSFLLPPFVLICSFFVMWVLPEVGWSKIKSSTR
ncbi:hypothetical protein AB1Y20_015902 [Prymnesium parvum]|uniref:Uncharacterized protein n=1 Tax=Prymnesium parvum TaxID=97485 RepID=A0AB34JZV5_PRYPA